MTPYAPPRPAALTALAHAAAGAVRLAFRTGRLRTFARFLFVLAGLTLCSAGVWITFGWGVGLMAAGLSCFVIEWLIGDGNSRTG